MSSEGVIRARLAAAGELRDDLAGLAGVVEVGDVVRVRIGRLPPGELERVRAVVADVAAIHGVEVELREEEVR